MDQGFWLRVGDVQLQVPGVQIEKHEQQMKSHFEAVQQEHGEKHKSSCAIGLTSKWSSKLTDHHIFLSFGELRQLHW